MPRSVQKPFVLLREGSRLFTFAFAPAKSQSSYDPVLLGIENSTCIAEKLVDGETTISQRAVCELAIYAGLDKSFVGYRAKRHTGVVDIDRRSGYAVNEFWEAIAARPDGSLILDPGEFYILASKEAVQVPPDYAAEMVPFDPLSVNSACTTQASSIPASAMPAGHRVAGGAGSRAMNSFHP